MRALRWVVALSLLCSPVAAQAGPNHGGTLILHANASLVYTSDQASWCGQAGLSACSLAVVSVPLEAGVTRVFHALAAFPDGAAPRLKALVFGVEWDSTRFVLQGSGPCGDTPFEVKDAGWPAPGTGVGMSWPAARTGQLSEVHWFAGYAYSDADTTSFSLAAHPVQGGQFADDAEPPAVDEIAGYGKLGFGTSGLVPCPDDSGNVIMYPGGEWHAEEDGGASPGEQNEDFEGLTFVGMASTSPGQYVASYHALKAQYGLRVLVGLVPDGLFCLLDDWQREALAVDDRVNTVTTQSIGGVPNDLLPGEPGFSAWVWNILRVPPPRDSLPEPPSETPDVFLYSPDTLRTPTPYQTTTTYMLGDIGLSLIFMESDSTGPCQAPTYVEDWTPQELAIGTANISRGFMRLAVLAPDWGLTFTFRDTVLQSTVEPIKYLPWNMTWVHQAMDQLDVQPNQDGQNRVWFLNNRMRSIFGFDWWFTAFVIRDVCDPDHRFPGGFPFGGAYSIWGPGEVLAYGSGVPNPGGLLHIPSHEACHVFGAPDEYQSASTCDSSQCGRPWGYLRSENGNCYNCTTEYDHSCVMSGMPYEFTACPYTRAHLGWRDLDDDGISDPVDHPASHMSMRIGDEESLALGSFVDISRGLAWVRRLAVSSSRLDVGRVLWDGIDYQGLPVASDTTYDWRVNQSPETHSDSLLSDSQPPEVTGIEFVEGDCYPGPITWCVDTLSIRLRDTDTHSGWVRATAAPKFIGGVPSRLINDRFFLEADSSGSVSKVPVTLQPGPYRLEIQTWDSSGDSTAVEDSICAGCSNPNSGVADRLASSSRFTLPRSRPNPTPGLVSWSLHVEATSTLALQIVGVDGRSIRTWPTRRFVSGTAKVDWDGTDDRGLRVPSGRYFLVVVDGSGRIQSSAATLVR